jgi:hypothetical protein
MAEGATQIDCLYVMDMIKENGLVNRGPRENWENREEKAFGLNLKSMVGNDRKKEKEDNSKENSNSLFHISFPPHPSPLPVGERDGVRGDLYQC